MDAGDRFDPLALECLDGSGADRLGPAWREDRPQAGFPDEFAQVLHDMRVPSDRETHEYEPGYRFRQLEQTPKSPAIRDKALNWQKRGPGNVAGRARGLPHRADHERH